MKKHQAENLAKYFYDLSKGTFILVVIGQSFAKGFNPIALFWGGLATFVFALTAYLIDEKSNGQEGKRKGGGKKK